MCIAKLPKTRLARADRGGGCGGSGRALDTERWKLSSHDYYCRSRGRSSQSQSLCPWRRHVATLTSSPVPSDPHDLPHTSYHTVQYAPRSLPYYPFSSETRSRPMRLNYGVCGMYGASVRLIFRQTSEMIMSEGESGSLVDACSTRACGVIKISPGLVGSEHGN